MAEKVRNGGFEQLGGNLFLDWTNSLFGVSSPQEFNPRSGEPVFQVESLTPIAGLRSGKIKITDLNVETPEFARAILRQPLNLRPFTEYLLSFSYRGGSTEVTPGRQTGIWLQIGVPNQTVMNLTWPSSLTTVNIIDLPFITPSTLTDADLSLEMTFGTRVGEAVFDNISIAPVNPLEFTLTIPAAEGGTTNPAPGAILLLEDSEITVQAKPDPGFTFDSWIINGQPATDNPITLIMTDNVTLEPTFITTPRKSPLGIFALIGALAILLRTRK